MDAPIADVVVGRRGYRRLLGAGSTETAAGVTLLGAVEAMVNDGPWVVPEDLRKLGGVMSISGGSADRSWSASVMAYDARWTATDQIPQRLIDAGSFDGRPFGRFDSLDPTSGGRTRRVSLSGQWQCSGESQRTRLAAYAMHYELALYSNFTYALERPATGDQFSQQDRRRVYGATASHALDHTFGRWLARTEFGVQLRHDRIRVGLFFSANRMILDTTREDAVRQTSAGVYAQNQLQWASWLRSVAGLRLERLQARVDALSERLNGGRASDRLVLPKLSLVLGPRGEDRVLPQCRSRVP